MRALLVLAMLGATVALPLAGGVEVYAQDAQHTGVIDGRVVNGTQGGPAIGPVPMSLLKFRKMTQEEERLGQADAEGRFHFEGLEVGRDVRYFVQAGYQNVAYRSPAIDLNQGPGQLEVRVFETTASDSAVSIRRASIAVPQVDSSVGAVAVLEIIAFVNDSDRTYVGDLFTNPDTGGVTRILLPPDAFDVGLNHGFGPEGVRPIQGGMASLTPLPPGEQEMIYTYGVPYSETEKTLNRVYAYPVRSITVLVPASGPKASSPDLTNQGPVDVGGVSNILLTGGAKRPGDVLTLTLSDLPRFASLRGAGGGGGVSLDTALRGAAVASVVAVVAAAFIYARSLRRRRLAPAGGVVVDVDGLEAERRSLVAALAELERRRRAGAMADEEYEQARRRQKSRLTDVLLLLRENLGEQA